MPLTNFPHGSSSFGIPCFGSGVMTQGKSFFVNPRTGSDGHSGLSIEEPLKTLSKAHDLCTAGQNDTVYLLAAGNSASDTTDYLTETLTWSKNNTHLVGVTGPGMFGHRARIATQTTGITPLVNITGSSCMFANVHVFHGVSADQTGLVGVQVTGTRNYFKNCHLAGGGVSTTADDAGMRSLKLSGGGENYFESCVIGLDTVSRTAANFEIEFDKGGASDANARTVFRDCIITRYSGTASGGFIQLDADGLDRYAIFQRCAFLNPIDSASTQMNEAIVAAAGTSPNGHIVLDQCTLVGADDWDDADTGRVMINMSSVSNSAGGLALDSSA